MSEECVGYIKKEETLHLVAFLDLLGASERIKSDTSSETLNAISEVFDLARNKWLNQEGFEIYTRIKSLTFSDNIVFALEVREFPRESGNHILANFAELCVFISYLSIFQSCSLEKGLLFRGGISHGKLYINTDENFVWGKALLDAIELEKSAEYPRIILGKSLLNYTTVPPNLPNVRSDFDGECFVDYLACVTSGKEGLLKIVRKMIEDERKRIYESISDSKPEMKILQKYVWLENYINSAELQV